MDVAGRNVIRKIILILVLCVEMFICAEQVNAKSYTEYEGNNYIGSADMINVSSGNSFSGVLSDEDDVDFIKFSLNKGSKIAIDFQGSRPASYSSNSNIEIEFYKEGETDRAFSYGSARYNNNLGYIYLKDSIYLTKGTYYIRLQEDWLYERVSYTLKFEVEEWENVSEPNNYISEAIDIVDGKKYYGLIDGGYNNAGIECDDPDFYKVTTDVAGTYYVILKNVDIKTSNVYPFSIEAYDYEGEPVRCLDGSGYIDFYDTGTKTIIANIPKGTTYFCLRSNLYSGKYELSVVKKLPAPKSVSANLYGYNDVNVSWSEVAGATGYHVYYKKSSADEYSYLGDYLETSANIENLSAGGKYYIRVIPYKTAEAGTYDGNYKTSSAIYMLKKISTPKISKKGSKVKVKWTNINGETGYQISKSTKKSATKVVSTYKTTKGTYKYITAKKNKTYYYKVRAYKVVDGEKIYGPWSKVKAYKRK